MANIQINLSEDRLAKVVQLMEYTRQQNPDVSTITFDMIVAMAIDVTHENAGLTDISAALEGGDA